MKLFFTSKMQCPEIVSIQWVHIITWLLVIIGWLIVNAQNNAREDRKEIKSLLEIVYKSIDEIERSAFKFHTADKVDPNLDGSIVRDFELLSSKIQSSGLKLSNNRNNELLILKQSITLNNFDASSRVSLKPADPRITAMRDACDFLKQKLDSSYRDKFIPKSWFRKYIFR